VCLGVLAALSAKDTAGKILGAFLPVCYFVLCGFEHCVANMYYISAGLMAKAVPAYAQLAAESGLDLSALTLTNFLLKNLLPVTLGNILGGAALGWLMWFCYLKKRN
jgi:formate/nitrite transporter FocA (FNT family)